MNALYQYYVEHCPLSEVSEAGFALSSSGDCFIVACIYLFFFLRFVVMVGIKPIVFI
jgi:hypothetical protein